MTGENAAPSQPFGGKYRPIAILGQGGMARVLLTVTQSGPGVHKLLVVKELKADLVHDAEFVAMFVDEARLAARLNHPNVLTTYEIGEANGAPFLVMEYLDGQPLHAVLPRIGRAAMPLAMHLHVLLKALEGLHYAHELCDFDGSPMHAVHRDVSPQNVFVCYDGQIKLLDFGIAKTSGSIARTEAGMFKGKLGYIAPEQITSPTVDRRADVFSVGVMLWEALARRRLTAGDSEAIVVSKRTSGIFPRIEDFNPDAPRDLVRICERAMALSPDDRFPTAEAMRAALEAAVIAAGMRVTDHEVGDLVTRAFSVERAKIQTDILAQLASATLSGSYPHVDLPNLSRESTPASAAISTATPELARAPAGISPRSVPPGEPATLTLSRIARPRHGRASLPWLVGGGLAALIGVLGGVALVVQRSRAATSAPAATAAPTARQTTALPAPPEAPASITVDVRVHPTSTRLSLDDTPLGAGPFHASVPKDGRTHELRASAPGYLPQERSAVFDRSVDLSITLVAVPPDVRPTVTGAGTDTAGADLKTSPHPKHSIDEKDPYK